jgi:endonuclease YncB( thermonuclease family)
VFVRFCLRAREMSPLRRGFCYLARRAEAREESEGWWAWVDLNNRPHPYQGCALAT